MLVVNFNVLVTLAPYNLAIVFCVFNYSTSCGYSLPVPWHYPTFTKQIINKD